MIKNLADKYNKKVTEKLTSEELASLTGQDWTETGVSKVHEALQAISFPSGVIFFFML